MVVTSALRWLPLALLLAGCGFKGPLTRLEPPDPTLSRAEQNAARAEERQRVEAGLALPADARPVRVDELTVKLDVRPVDPFSLPPPGTPGALTPPFPGDPVAPPPPPFPPAPSPAPPTP